MLELGSADAESGTAPPLDLGVIAFGGVDHAAVRTVPPARIIVRGVTLGEGAAIRFGYAVDDAAPGKAARFEIAVAEAGGEPHNVWSARAAPRDRWTDVTLDLGRFAGHTVDIELSNHPVPGRSPAPCFWADPEILSVRVAAPPAHVTVLRDLLRESGPARLVLPPSSTLHLEAIALPAGPNEATAEATVAAFVDGRSVFERALHRGGVSSVRWRVPLPSGPTPVDVDIRVDGCTAPPWRTARIVAPSSPAPRLGEAARVILLVVDTLRADALGLYGCPEMTSPHLDRLSRRSQVFERAIAQSSWTLPSMSSLWSGAYPTGPGPRQGMGLRDADDTLPALIEEAGFTTFGLVASPLMTERQGFDRGFSRYTVIPWARAPHLNGLFVSWLAEHAREPVFAYLHYMEPHSPYDPPAALGRLMLGFQPVATHRAFWQSKGSPATARSPIPGCAEPTVERMRAAYEGEVLSWDLALGDLCAGLHRHEDGRTTICVMADHGEELHEHGKLGHGQQLYEESLHVPLLLGHGGGQAPALQGTLEAAPVELRSVGAMLLDRLAMPSGARAPEKGMTVSYLPSPMGSQDSRFAPMCSAGDGHWKYIDRPDGSAPELYDLGRDPAETRNRAPAHPAVLRELRRRLRNVLPSSTPVTPPPVDRETEEALRALGYVQ